MSEPAATEPPEGRRRYDSTKRRLQAQGTRDRIVEAGSDLLRRSGLRDWRALTIRGVAEAAGVSERTVYRHFGDEKGLRDAVMHRHEEKAGIDLATMELADVATVAALVFDHVSAFPLEARPPLDPTLADANERQRRALLDAVGAGAVPGDDGARVGAAAVFDVLWSVGAYERLVSDWALEPEQAIAALTWAIGLVTDAVRAGEFPPAS